VTILDEPNPGATYTYYKGKSGLKRVWYFSPGDQDDAELVKSYMEAKEQMQILVENHPIEEIIKKRVVDQLFWDNRIDASNINVRVTGQTVTLTGSVPNYSTRIKAVENVCLVKDVIQVNDNLKIEPPPGHTTVPDETIQTNIRNWIQWNPNINSSNISVKVKKGVVFLEGTIDTYWKKVKTQTIAGEANGVLDIVNRLAVVPTLDIVDHDIAKNIIAALNRSFYVNIENFDVKVKKGRVTLKGYVRNWQALRTVLNTVENTTGVVDVTNRLQIKPA
jgi:osmotically-inducible protein OsmY